MDTIKSTIDAAGKVLFGDQANQQAQQGQNVEPQSGITGNTKAGEPYDAGNIDQSTSATNTSGNIGGSGYTQKDDAHAFNTSREIPRDNTSSNQSGNPLSGQHPEGSTVPLDSRSGNTSANQSGNPTGNFGGQDTTSGNPISGQKERGPTVGTSDIPDRDQTGNTGLRDDGHRTHGSSTGFSGTSSSIGALSGGVGDKNAPSSREEGSIAQKAGAVLGNVLGGGTAQKQGSQGGAYGTTQQQHSSVGAVGKHQGSDVPHAEPKHGHENDAIRDSKRQAEHVAGTAGAGNETGGGSGADQKAYGGEGVSHGRVGSLTGHLPGAPGGEGLQKTSVGTGTGQEYVKSSGMAAEGGDFDASKPGAGKEADRLMEQSGVSHPGAGSSKPVDTTSSTTGGAGQGHSTGHSSSTGTHTGTGHGNTGTGTGHATTGAGNTSSNTETHTEGHEKVSLKDKIKAKIHRS